MLGARIVDPRRSTSCGTSVAATPGKGDAASPLPNIPGSLVSKGLVIYDPAPYTPEIVKERIARWNQIFKTRK